jgi:pilus assembly protein Flp/PilA
LRDEDGLTIVEYAVAAGLITLIVVTAFTDLGKTVLGIIQGINTELEAGGGGGGTPTTP